MIGNVGDGEAVLSRGDEAVHMSPVHNPGRASENARILAANGWVTTEQVRTIGCDCGSHTILTAGCDLDDPQY